MNCGLDFGTSNSTLSLCRERAVTLVPLEGEEITIPSAVFYAVNASDARFGKQAMRLFMEGEEGRFMRSLKRILGTSLMNDGTVVNGKLKRFEDVLGDFIGNMKAAAERHSGVEMTNVVMGRPVHFADNDSKTDSRAQDELQNIAKAVGFKHVAFQYEPIAAAFAHERTLRSEQLALVADIGGGTSDFTVIRLAQNMMDKSDRTDDILGNSGIRIGGNDFDKDLSLSAFMPDFGYGTDYGEKNLPLPAVPFHDMSEWSKINFLYTPKMHKQMRDILPQSHAPEKFSRYIKLLEEGKGHQLLAAVEECKIGLTDHLQMTALLDFVEAGFAVSVARAVFNAAVDKHVRAIVSDIDDCLRQAQVREKDVELIILTGGTTEVPLLKKTVAAKFPQADISEENKLSSVGLGLGYEAIRRFGTAG
ncbi:MAG: Hsp70 family protein [Alphaproteobacteria bacterium]|nr:MAG: Hsp70 family protein [Alphaproteobacteria bacterium]